MRRSNYGVWSTCLLPVVHHPLDYNHSFSVVMAVLTFLPAFLSTLRTNIQISTTDSLPASPMVPSTRHSILPQPSPSPLSMMTSYQRQGIAPAADPLPKLKTYSPSTNAEKLSALRLVADSVAQQRQQAAKMILKNPYVLATMVLIMALEAYWLNAIALLTTGCGTIMTVLLTIRWLTNPYIDAAERINWDWLTDATTTASTPATSHSRSYSNGHKRSRSASIEDPVLMVTKWGEEIIGALVIRVSKRDKKGFVRAWTVAHRYRGKGVGKDLLQEGVKVAMGKSGVKGVVFEEDNARKFISLQFVLLRVAFCLVIVIRAALAGELPFHGRLWQAYPTFLRWCFLQTHLTILSLCRLSTLSFTIH